MECSERRLPGSRVQPEIEWREVRMCGYLCSSAICSHCVLSRPLVFRRIYRYLCYGFFFLNLLNVHINEYVLFIDVFGFRNIELEK